MIILAPAAATLSTFSLVDCLLNSTYVELPYSAACWINWQYSFLSVRVPHPHDVPAIALTTWRRLVSFFLRLLTCAAKVICVSKVTHRIGISLTCSITESPRQMKIFSLLFTSYMLEVNRMTLVFS